MIDPSLLAASPEEVGLDPQKVNALFERVERDVKEGILPGAQVAIGRNGKIGARRSFGRVKHHGQDAPATDDTLICVFSCTKAITSVLAWQLIERGELDVRERVAAIVPEFGTHGKDVITVEQVLTHTSGFPNAPFNPVFFRDREKRLERFAAWRLNWEPGSRFEYHPSSGMYVIAEILERRTGRTYAELTRECIALPLGLPDLWVGLPRELHGRLADVEHVGKEPTAEDYAAVGLPTPPESEVNEESLGAFNRADVREAGIPGGGATTTASDLALFYQALISPEARLCRPETVRMACEVRTGAFIDPMSGVTAHRGLGVSVAGDERRGARGFGKGCSPIAFGHGGAGGQLGWVDPVSGISIGYATAGHDRNPMRRARRGVAIGSLAASCKKD